MEISQLKTEISEHGYHKTAEKYNVNPGWLYHIIHGREPKRADIRAKLGLDEFISFNVPKSDILTCACGKQFYKTRTDRKYCSDNCGRKQRKDKH